MDKYEFNIKVEQIKKLVSKGDFETAMKIADTIDWRRVRNANLLAMISQVYEKNQEYQEAKEVLLLAFERAPIGKRLLYKLTELALLEGSIGESEDYYREFCDLAPEDGRQHLLRYMILNAKGANDDQLIHSLESYVSTELDEKWMYELAALYARNGQQKECIQMCDRIMLMFGIGKYVDKAMELKTQFVPLTDYQMDLANNRDKYEAKLQAVKAQYNQSPDDFMDEEMAVGSEPAEPVRPQMAEPEAEYDELVASLHQARAEEKLAAEMSRISAEDMVAGDAEESPLDKTREFRVLRGMSSDEPAVETVKEPKAPKAEPKAEKKPEPVEILPETREEEAASVEDTPVPNHLMIEARTPEKGLQMAVDALKKIHMENGASNQVLKITGSKLNKRGIKNVADKVAGKDLIIEEAGDLTREELEELQKLIVKDQTGLLVVLIDNPRQMEELHRQNPDLAKLFECIGAEEETLSGVSIEEALKKQVEEQEHIARETEAPVAMAVSSDKEKTAVVEPMVQEAPIGDDEEMDLDTFADYACQYAAEIDCSITGKSMLALYERIEIMEEDGIPLTKANAEDLIEEAADRAEKPSLGRRITGVFSSKYDKDGLLILKEEHFI